MTQIPLSSPVITNSYDGIPIEAMAFRNKSSIVWNNGIQNIHVKKGEGLVTTRGDILSYEQLNNKDDVPIGVMLTNELGHKKKIEYNWILSDTYRLPKYETGECIASVIWDGLIYSIWEVQIGKTSDYFLYVTNMEDMSIKESRQLFWEEDVPVTSAILAPSNIKGDNEPLLCLCWIKQDDPYTAENHIRVYRVTSEVPFIDYTMENTGDQRYVPLGKMSSGLRRLRNNGETRPCTIVAFEDIDHNRCRAFMFDELDDGSIVDEMIKWIGYVSPEGVMTGEPYPDKGSGERQPNGTYKWDTFDGNNQPQSYNMIGGYYFTPNNEIQAIVVDSVSATEWYQSNMSVNDEADDPDQPIDPKRYIVLNYAESKGVYYNYGKGWVRSYNRKVQRNAPTILALNIFTFGCKGVSSQRFRREGLLTENGKAIPYVAKKLNQRVYTLGFNNIGDYSLLNVVPWTVEVFNNFSADSSERTDFLNLQVNYGEPISMSFNRSLLINGNEKLGNWDCQVNDMSMEDMTEMTVSNNRDIHVIKKSADIKYLKPFKIADYIFGLNILDSSNVIYDDDNMTLDRYGIPYNGDAFIDFARFKFTAPPASTQSSPVIWQEGIGFNALLLTSESRSTSYLMPPIQIPIFINNAEFEQYKRGIENRGNIITPILAGSFTDYEYVDVFYGSTDINGGNIPYRSTNVIKAKYNAGDEDTRISGKATYDLQKAGTSYIFNVEAGMFMPLGVGSSFYNVNNYAPSVNLNADYVAYLYRQNNITMTSFNFSNRIKNAKALFTIFGQSYYYDGRNIVNIGSEASFNQSSFVLYALGLQFVGNSANEAWLYSDHERRLFSFSGSNTLTGGEILSNMGELRESFFNTKDQTLYILFDDGLYVKTEQDSAFIKDTTIEHIYSSDLGVALSHVDGSVEIFSLYEKAGFADTKEFFLETADIGDNSRLSKCSSFDIVLRDNGLEKTTVDVAISSVCGYDRSMDSKRIVINRQDWKGKSYRIRLIPPKNVGNGFSVNVKSKDFITVVGLFIDSRPVSEKQATNMQFT